MTTIDNAETPKAEKRIIELNNLIDEYLIEEEKEKVQSLYQDCIHRDGIPRMLLNEMRETINIELSNLLISVGFNVFFDENLNLKMYDEIKPEAVLHVIGGSGKQRTFISIALRLALRQVNNRCVNNLLFMDELMGKLVDNSVTEFIQLLEEAKLKIEKIFIVEHAYSDQLNPDHIIEIKKDAEGVSQIKLY
jgi:DNA repair exonuclease SbcCD ATPase subunit